MSFFQKFQAAKRDRSPMPEETLDKLVEGLKNYTNNPKELLTKYRVDYFYVGPYEKRITKKDTCLTVLL